VKRTLTTACGCVNEDGFGNARSWTPWPASSGQPPRLRWRAFSQRPFERFGRLDLLCKYAVAAVEMLDLPPPPERGARPDTALYLGTEHGSLDVDVKFHQSIGQPGGASPTLFSYTLPSTAAGEIAIRHAITGPSMCLLAGPESGWLALWEGAKLVAAGDAARCICVGCDAVSLPLANTPIGHAYAFLVEAEANERLLEPLAELKFTRARDAKSRALRGDEPGNVLARTFRFLADNRTRRGAALYLKAPATLMSSEALVMLSGPRSSNGRTG